MRATHIAIVLALLLLAALPAMAAPKTLVVQGALVAAGGGPISDGVYSVAFFIYAEKAAKDAVWASAVANIDLKGGRFVHVLGIAKPFDDALLAGLKTPFLGVQLGIEPELPRLPLHSVAWAMIAGRLSCTGCVGANELAAGSISADKVGFTYAGAKTKGGPAAMSLDVSCTGCVSVDEMKWDKDVDLGGQALKAKKLVATEVAATTVTATTFLGDGSKLSGIKVPAGSCSAAGEVVKGIAADGTLVCIKAMDPDALPANGLSAISNGLLANEFLEQMVDAKALPIPDNNPIGASAKLLIPDWGLAQKLTITVDLANSDISKLTLLLFDPKGAGYTLYEGGKTGKTLKQTWTVPGKLVKGDLTPWIGANIKGTWQLKVVDTAFANNGNDGQVNSWSIQVEILSDKKLANNGLAQMLGGVDFASSGTSGFRFEVAAKAPVTCDAKQVGYTYFNNLSSTLLICDGKAFQPIAQVSPGTTQNSAGKSCKNLLDKGQTDNGTYWLDPDGGSNSNAFTVYCDMTGGGWTQIAVENTADAAGWSDGTLTNATVAGAATKVHGVWGTGGASHKSFDLKGVVHSQVKISGRYYAIDSWDNENNGAQLWLDGAMRWSAKKTYSQNGQGAGWVTAKFTPAPWGNNAGPNGYWKLETALPAVNHGAAKVLVRFATGIDQAKSDESFAFSHVGVWVK